MERKHYAFTLKQVDLDARTFEGHAAIFNIPDDGDPPDIMMPGAFTKTIQEWGPSGKNRIKVLALHLSNWLPIGKPIELMEDATGLFFKAQISETTLGRDVMTLIRDQVLTEMSIGFTRIKWTIDREANVWRVLEVRLFEISPVIWAMHPNATIQNAKALLDELTDDRCSLPEEQRATAIERLTALLEQKEPGHATPPSQAAAHIDRDDPILREVCQSIRNLNTEMQTQTRRSTHA